MASVYDEDRQALVTLAAAVEYLLNRVVAMNVTTMEDERKRHLAQVVDLRAQLNEQERRA